MSDEFAALWAGVLAAPEDAAPKLVAADWLAERDADPDLEAGLRWAAEYEWWPRPPTSPSTLWGTWLLLASRWEKWPRPGLIVSVCSLAFARGAKYCGCSAESAEQAVGHVGHALLRMAAEKSPSPR